MPNITSATKYFPKAQENFTTTAATTIAPGASIVPLQSVGSYTNGDTVVLTIDPGLSSQQVFTGVVDTSGVRITGVVWTEGNNVTHTIGATVTDYDTATHISLISTGILKSRNTDGSSKYSYNVKELGAKGDGSTDDTTIIQSALDSAASAGGGTVYLPAATYIVSNLQIDSYVELRGGGRGTILKAKSGATGSMITLKTPATTQQVYIGQLTLQPNTGTLNGIKLDNTGFGSSIDPVHIIENVVVLSAGGDAFHFDNNLRELRMVNCYAHNSGGYGYYIGAGNTDSRFINCTNGPSTNHGFYVLGNDNNFTNCKSFWSGFNGSTWGTTQAGFYLSACSYVNLVNCAAEQNALHGFDIQSASHCSIVGNYSSTNSAGTSTGCGINTNASTYCSIIGNVGNVNGVLTPGAQKYGLQVAGTQTSTVFLGNTVTGSSGDFNYVSGTYGMIVDASNVDFSTTGQLKVANISDPNGATWIGQVATVSAVNYLKITNNSTGNPAKIAVDGTDGNASLQIDAKGNGNIQLGANSTGDILSVRAFNVMSGTATPVGGTQDAGLKFGTTAHLGVFFGSGAPTLSAAQGSLYIRTDGSSTSTRLYVNTTGSTTWTNVTTAT